MRTLLLVIAGMIGCGFFAGCVVHEHDDHWHGHHEHEVVIEHHDHH